MRAVLRIALAYFGMLGLQLWLNVLGLAFIAVAAALFILAANQPNAPESVFAFCCIGVGLILVMPAFGGGIGMRLGSRPGVLHLRPHGRLRMLLGATVAVTLFALLAALPSLATYAFLAAHGLDTHLRLPSPLLAFEFMWALFALGFIYMFCISWSVLGMFSSWLLPFAITQLVNRVEGWADLMSPALIVAVGLFAWSVFTVWYLRAGAIRRPVPQFGNTAGTTDEDSPFRWLLLREDRTGEPTRALATSHYLLGSASGRLHLLTGLWIAGIFVLLHVFSNSDRPAQPGPMLFMLPFLAFQFGALGYATARRARLLWLRAGMTRDSLFRLGERQALRACLITWSVVATVAFALSALPDPSRIPQVLLYVAASAAVGTVVFYAGFATVRAWHVGDVLLYIFLAVLFLVQFVIAAMAWKDGDPATTTAFILLAAGILTLAMRWLAHRRWCRLDWRIATPPTLSSRRS
jgi:hypothetical protein